MLLLLIFALCYFSLTSLSLAGAASTHLAFNNNFFLFTVRLTAFTLLPFVTTGEVTARVVMRVMVRKREKVPLAWPEHDPCFATTACVHIILLSL